MLNSLFVNASILISFLYLGSRLFTVEKFKSKSDLNTKLLTGVIFGLTGCLLMFNAIILSNNMIMDFRIMALMISSLYCGPVSALITAIIMMAFRMLYYGINSASLTALFNLTVLFVIFSIISTAKLDFKKKYIYMSAANLLSSIGWTFMLVKDKSLILSILLKYMLSTTVVSIIIYFMMVYIYKTNEIYLQLKRDSIKDFLTGLYNVREFDRLLSDLSVTAADKNEDLSLLMIDIDFFKTVNDTYGHLSGDMVLKQLSSILTNSCRSFDIVSRQGGEEFTVILRGSKYRHALEIAERIRENVENYLFMVDDNKEINITVSIGVSSYPGRTNHPNDLLHEADNALYSAKRNGRNRVE